MLYHEGGIVLIVLRVIDVFNMFNFDKVRKKVRPPAIRA
ncbi:Unannotated [Lentimonas sp. CC21]|nr:Unannotated [Lentimonas sp. CC21]